MAQFGKSSSKKGKPSYTGAIIGVSLVLFLFGIVGWFFLNLRKTGDYFKANKIKGFYPVVEIDFTVFDNEHYHVPLLINPFGYSTYRGS